MCTFSFSGRIVFFWGIYRLAIQLSIVPVDKGLEERLAKQYMKAIN